jgi:large conductance mechanosensitive channel
MLKEFKDFLFRGNLLDLAVAVVVGAAFTTVVNSFVRDLITPFIAAVVGKPNFDNLTFTINHSQFQYGSFFNAVLSFVLVAAVLFFFVIKPVNHMMSRLGRLPDEDPARDCPECLSKVPAAATRCSQCTTVLVPAGPADA